MSVEQRLLQRYHDGEASRAEAAGAERLLSEQPELRPLSQRLEALDRLFAERVQTIRRHGRSASQVIQAAMARLPNRVPRRQARLSVGHAAMGLSALMAVVMGSAIAERMRDIVPVDTVALFAALCGLALLVAARPLVRIEATLFARLMRRSLAVGDGDVLVCRVLGLALLIGGSHLVGLWG
jgi:anti-sigma factor RsiW